jgi:Fe/S biogenesis protein NfuA
VPVDHQVLAITDDALRAILDIRSREPDAGELGLRVAIAGVRGSTFSYELAFVPVVDAGEGDSLTHRGDLPVIVPAGSIEFLQEATLRVGESGLAIDNPNSPTQPMDVDPPEIGGTIAERVSAMLARQINPAINGHGGWVELVGVEGNTVYLRLGGGCQGCGMANVTLRNGIEATLRQAVPEIGEVIDVTDHQSGIDPYYS